MASDTAMPNSSFPKSLVIIGNDFLYRDPFNASSLPASNPTNTKVVLIGILLYCLKYSSSKAYTRSIIVADLTYLVFFLLITISWIFPPLYLNTMPRTAMKKVVIQTT